MVETLQALIGGCIPVYITSPQEISPHPVEARSSLCSGLPSPTEHRVSDRNARACCGGTHCTRSSFPSSGRRSLHVLAWTIPAFITSV
eukprot:CAMPEP_0113930462 /NCGR_PEP_ID=MMETSP1159-20121227/5960_1 /TAXON_ID=88271 /ORGANISM="Picocystis salinarum" /LENGTH=87 /DNA_ID=CAMNT_0000931241 /DNA_START=235 /DNA_END=495 /DNA_ORIENTATION=- /assembly_acc=CAM_ASM_000767